MGSLKRIAAFCFRAFHNASVFWVSRTLNQEIERRNARRGHNAFRWFTPEEAAVAEALAHIIVPSDEETPGLDDVDVLGPSAMVVLDKLIKTSSHKQYVYSRGLLSFDV